MKKIFLIILNLSLILICACSPIIKKPPEGSYTSSQLKRNLLPEVEAQTLKDLSIANSTFALNFYQQVSKTEGNLIFSPFSLSLALSMTIAGAQTETHDEMLQALSLEALDEDLHPAFNALLLAIEASQKDLDNELGEGQFILNIANSTFGQSGYNFKPDFLDILAINYGSGMRLVDYINNPEGSRQSINNWVKQETAGKIPKLVPENAISPLTRLVLANAIYFNGAWYYPFQEFATKTMPFTLLDGTKESVQMMRLSGESFYYSQASNYQAVRFPYLSQDFAMLIIIPDEGKFNEFETEISGSNFTAINDSLSFTPITLQMPKFDIETALSAPETLKALGMRLAFDPEKADFSGMTEEEKLYIDNVIHKATITVDEQGTEAAAATAVVMVTESMPMEEPISLIIDRPFLFVIQHLPTGTILFLGRFVAP